MDKTNITNEERKKSIIMNGNRCKTSNSNHVFNCHCNDCYHNIISYLGKEKGKRYLYTGEFAPDYIQGKEVVINSFCADEDEETSSCECFIHLADSDYGYEWIPRKEIIHNLVEVSPTSQTSPKGDFSNEKEHNMGDKVPTSSPPKLSPTEITSHHPNIIRNSDTSLAGLVQLKDSKNLYTELPQSI